VLAVPAAKSIDDAEEPVLVTKGVLRVAARFSGRNVDRRNRLSEGRLEVARMIGGPGRARDVHLGLIELAASVCRSVDPLCAACPLSRMCQSAVTGAAPATGASVVQAER
jgi:DNA (cytosine-5)-methyltransferase 1